MNCKPGDFARIVAPAAERHRNYFVTVVRRAAYEEILGNGIWHLSRKGLIAWVCNGRIPGRVVDDEWITESVIADAHLRPIRDQPGEDETLTWAPVPGVLVESV